uniref:Uncharacterized protein n=1 Tax=Arundo donax TaxID=35708 RepID=A0A0A9I264_ARUDO
MGAVCVFVDLILCWLVVTFHPFHSVFPIM